MDVDWGRLLLPDTPLLEIFIRGTLTYLVLFAILGLTLNRSSSSIGMTDLLVIVLIADAAQNAMGDDYTSWTHGLFLILTIVGGRTASTPSPTGTPTPSAASSIQGPARWCVTGARCSTIWTGS